MARVFVGMVLSFPFPTPWVLITWGGVFSTQILTRLHTWALSNVSKTRVQNQINSKEEGDGGGSSFSSSAEMGDGSTMFPSCIG